MFVVSNHAMSSQAATRIMNGMHCPQTWIRKSLLVLFLVSLIGFVIIFGIPTMCAIQGVFSFASADAALSGPTPEVGEAVSMSLTQIYKKGETTADGPLFVHQVLEIGELLIKDNINSHVVLHHLASGAPPNSMMAHPHPMVPVLDTSCPCPAFAYW